MLGAFAVEFNADAAAAGWVDATFGGFLAGTIFSCRSLTVITTAA